MICRNVTVINWHSNNNTFYCCQSNRQLIVSGFIHTPNIPLHCNSIPKISINFTMVNFLIKWLHVGSPLYNSVLCSLKVVLHHCFLVQKSSLPLTLGDYHRLLRTWSIFNELKFGTLSNCKGLVTEHKNVSTQKITVRAVFTRTQKEGQNLGINYETCMAY